MSLGNVTYCRLCGEQIWSGDPVHICPHTVQPFRPLTRPDPVFEQMNSKPLTEDDVRRIVREELEKRDE